MAAYSIEGSIDERIALPDSIPTGIYLNTKFRRRMVNVPVNTKGG